MVEAPQLDTKTIDTITALLNTSEAQGASENEAAVAARHVMRLLARANLSMAEFERLANPVEEIGSNNLGNTGQSIPMWKTNLLNALGDAHFCDLYISNGYRSKSHVLVGRPTNVEACKIIYAYLVDVVDQSAREALRTYTGWESPKTFGNSFRMGMVGRIAQRLRDEMRAIHRENVEDATRKAEALGTPDSPVGSSCTSIVVANIYEEAQKEIQAYYRSKGVKLASMGYKGSTGSGAGYNAGRKAGDNVPLHASKSLNQRNK